MMQRHDQETKGCLFSLQQRWLSIETFSQSPPAEILGALLTPPPPS